MPQALNSGTGKQDENEGRRMNSCSDTHSVQPRLIWLAEGFEFQLYTGSEDVQKRTAQQGDHLVLMLIMLCSLISAQLGTFAQRYSLVAFIP